MDVFVFGNVVYVFSRKSEFGAGFFTNLPSFPPCAALNTSEHSNMCSSQLSRINMSESTKLTNNIKELRGGSARFKEDGIGDTD